MPLSVDQIRALQTQVTIPPGNVAPTYLTWLGPTDDDVNWTSGPDDEVVKFHGDPNTVQFAAKGTLGVDLDAPALWQNTDGVSAWSQVGAGGASSFPITFNDGTYTYTIAIVSGKLRLRTITNAGSVLNEDLELGPADVTLVDNTVNGINIFTGGVGSNGGFFVSDSGGGMSFFTSANCSITASAQLGLEGDNQVRLTGPEVIHHGQTATPTSGDLGNGEFAFWFDSAAHTLNVKGRDSGGTIRNLVIGTLT